MNKYIIFLFSILATSFSQSLIDCPCDSGKYLHLDKKKCEPNPTSGSNFVQGCAKYASNYVNNVINIFCAKCEDGRYNNPDTGACDQKTTANCAQYSQLDDGNGNISIICSTCDENFYVDQNACYAYPLDGETSYIEGCEEYGIRGGSISCIECLDGEYYNSSVNTSQCQIGNKANCDEYENDGDCDECEDGYIEYGGNCLAEPTGNNALSNCAEYSTTDGTNFDCERCTGLFYRDYSDKRCKALDSDVNVSNCYKYTSASMCTECASGYFSPNTNKCTMCPPSDGSAAVDDGDGDGDGDGEGDGGNGGGDGDGNGGSSYGSLLSLTYIALITLILLI